VGIRISTTALKMTDVHGTEDLKELQLVIKRRVMGYKLRYRLHSDAPAEFSKRWQWICSNIKEDPKREALLTQWIGRMQALVAEMPEGLAGQVHEGDLEILNRCEGGIGGDSNARDRQMRFEEFSFPWSDYGEITVHALPSDDKLCMWMLEDVKLFGQGLLDVFEFEMECRCVEFYVVVD